MDMRERELAFAKALQQAVKTAKQQGNCISETAIKEAFDGQELTQQQLGLVYDYLKQNKIGIGEPLGEEEYLEPEERDYLAMYLEDLSILPERSDGEARAIAISAMAGDSLAKESLVELYLPQVVDVAKLYAGQGVYLEDLIGEGNVALSSGVEMLGCLEKPEEIQGFFGKLIMDAMEGLIAKTTDAGRSGEKLADKVNEVSDLAKELSESLGRKVTVEELAEETKLSEKRIRDAIRISGGQIEYVE